MDDDLYEEQTVLSGHVTSINFNVLSEADTVSIHIF